MAWTKQNNIHPTKLIALKRAVSLRERLATALTSEGASPPGWLILLFCFFFPTWTAHAGDGHQYQSGTPPYTTLWEKQSYLHTALAGFRSVRETDIFTVRTFNPTGPDLVGAEEFTLTTRQGMHPLVTLGGATHRNLIIANKKYFRLHAHISAGLMFQKLIIPSTLDRPGHSAYHFPVHHYNMPAITTYSLSGGLWFYERVGTGFRVNHLRYRIHTSDDRLEQRSLTLQHLLVMPYITCIVPLHAVGMSRWTGRAILFVDPSKDAHNTLPEGELALFRLSQQRTGRATGLFIRFLSIPPASGDNLAGLTIHRDIQVVAGISRGTGGHNRRGGR